MALRDYIPYLLAAGAGGAGLYFLGYDRKGKAFKEGMEPWACAIGGLLVGYTAGKVVQNYLAPKAVPLPSPPPSQPSVSPLGEYLDLEVDTPRLALPPPRVATHQPAKRADVRAVTADDAAVLNDMGSFATSGEDGMGSYDTGADADEIDVDQLMRESGYAGRNGHN